MTDLGLIIALLLLLSGKTNNVVINGLRSALPLASPNSIQASPFSKYYYKTLINKPI